MSRFKPTHRLDSDDLAELEHEFDSRVYDGRYGLFYMVDGSSLVHPMSNATALPKVLQVAAHEEPEPLTDEQLLRAIQSIGPNGAGRIALTFESGPYDIDRLTNIAVLLCRAIERTHGIVRKESGKCNRCGGEMKPGQALENTLVGEPDDIGGCVTLSPGGPGKLVPCMKCAECGRSVTVGSGK